MRSVWSKACVWGVLQGMVATWGAAQVLPAGPIDLPTSKRLLPGVPGSPKRLNGLPISMARSPDGRYVVTVNAGYGTVESRYMQSLAVVDTRTGEVTDSPDERTLVDAGQTLYSGLAFSRDGRHLYGTIGSLTDPAGKTPGDTGNGIVVYGFAEGRITRERVLPIPLQHLDGARRTKLVGAVDGGEAVPFPSAVVDVPAPAQGRNAIATQTEHLLVADNLSDDVLLMDAVSGAVLHRFDMAESDAVPSTYPIALAIAPGGRRAFVALWNASEIVELDLERNVVARKLPLLKPSSPTMAGTHPCAFALAPDGETLYVALANRDAVAAVEVKSARFAVKGYFDTRLPGQSYFGAEPEALALSDDGRRLFAADGALDAVAVLDTTKLRGGAGRKGMIEPMGFVPTEWMPMSMATAAGRLYVATAKGHGTGPNNFAQRLTPETAKDRRFHRSFTYIGTLLHGSVAAIDLASIDAQLPQWTETVIESNRMRAGAEMIHFAGGGKESRIQHVIYIIKENRTYDQIFGDLAKDGARVGNGDPSLTMYGEAITPNQHKLALQFGVLDNFFDSGEVSGDGHVWSNAAIGTDYLEKTWQQNYRGGQRSYDFEGVVAEGYPSEQHIADVNEPASGYLWGNLARHGKTLYHFGEYIASTFCNEKGLGPVPSQEGPMLAGETCAQPEIKPGAAIPEAWGGGVNRWPWAIPMLAANVPTKPELVGHFAPEQPDFNLLVPDQIRAEVFLRHLKGWLRDREQGHDTMPSFVMLRFANDHTAGTRPGGPTPASSVADNDLAVGRAVEAISHSPFWEDTALFILEDDAQNGADHVDAHRSTALLVSKYAPHGGDGRPFVDSRFLSTVSMIRTMETVLGLPPMNNNDAFSSMLASELEGPGDQPAFVADRSNEVNSLIYKANAKSAPGAAESERMDFRHADRADARRLNVILWRDAMGDRPAPASLLETRKKAARHDDDE